MEPYLAALCGAAGALIPDVLKIINNRFGDAPNWLKTWHYWLGVALLVVVGGGVALFEVRNAQSMPPRSVMPRPRS